MGYFKNLWLIWKTGSYAASIICYLEKLVKINAVSKNTEKRDQKLWTKILVFTSKNTYSGISWLKNNSIYKKLSFEYGKTQLYSCS